MINNEAPVAHLDRVSVSEAEGSGFDSRRAHQALLIGFEPSLRKTIEPVSDVKNTPLKYFSAYSSNVQAQVNDLLQQGKLADYLLQKYPLAHEVTTDKALYSYVLEVKNKFMRNAAPLNKALFDSKIQVIKHALGLHTSISRVQGGKLKTKREIRIASLFKNVPVEFLNMITVHELAHFKEHDHNKAFYLLCTSMERDYHQFEFDLRLYLTHLDVHKQPLW